MSSASDAAPAKLRVFISYSRKDGAFAHELLSALELTGFDAYLDQHDIAAGEDWAKRLDRMIEAADTVVFVISPDFVASTSCAREVERSIALGKRLLPIVWKRVDDAAVPERLRQLNYIFFDAPLMSVPALVKLTTALHTDVDWVREHTRIGEAAMRWEARGRVDALHLRGVEVQAAKAWLAAQPQFAPEPSLLHLEFIRASEEQELARSDAERMRLDEMAGALKREREAHHVRELALARERVALRWGQRALALCVGLFACVVMGAAAWYQQQALYEFYTWHARMGPSVVTGAEEGEVAAKAGGEFQDCRVGCPVMVVVPPGAFTMGSADVEAERRPDEGPQHAVTVPKALAVSKFEVSFAEWDVCVAAGACPDVSDRGWGRGERPAIFLSWSDAKDYAAWLSRITGRVYRLLSEAEWEYAARAGTQSVFAFGDGMDAASDYAWFKDNSGERSQERGKKLPNAFGLHDMAGNAYEWLEDCWNESYEMKPQDLKASGAAWVAGDCDQRVVRGGSWRFPAAQLRSADRNRVSIGLRANDLGFRLAREFDP
ncbi:MAG: SUMF1/EgtB/PvdO family nonheme iron enzyme [Hyphomicrobium sp.]|nr:SUMF1/EgtB/PvdO family nonheme iron enzyme [Hyphomicrobium sp.]